MYTPFPSPLFQVVQIRVLRGLCCLETALVEVWAVMTKCRTRNSLGQYDRILEGAKTDEVLSIII